MNELIIGLQNEDMRAQLWLHSLDLEKIIKVLQKLLNNLCSDRDPIDQYYRNHKVEQLEDEF